uniref:DNA-directed RNA polymerase n=1 Tax=Sparus aurata TaxID=8175 RepID=A0A671UEM3_SPAAU
RILQLQSDVVVDVQHAKVQFVNAHSSGKVKVASDRDPKSTPSDIPKSGKTVAKGASDPKPSRWMEKLTNEKKNLKKWQHVQQKLQKNVKEKPLQKSLGQTVSQLTSLSNPERLQEDNGEIESGETQQNIRSYLEACVFAGHIEKAHRFLLSQHRLMKRRRPLNTDIYNIMIRVWAKKGALNQIGRVFIMLEDAGLKPNLGSYCYALECMGRNPDCSPKTIIRCLNQMEEDGLSVDDVFSQCSFREDERDMVLKAMHIVEPDYQPRLSMTTDGCSLPLVEDFYKQVLQARFKLHHILSVEIGNSIVSFKLLVILLKSYIANMSPSGESLKVLAKDLGNRVYTKYCVRQKHQNQILEKLGNIYNAYTELLAKDTKEFGLLPREHWCQLEKEQSSGPTLEGGETNWLYSVTLELGTYMVDLMVKSLKISGDILNPAYDKKLIPILYHMYAFRSTRQIGFIKPHPILTQIQQEAMETKLTFDSYVMPMLCPPVPWSSIKFGAYLLTPTKLMRTVEGATQHDTLLEKCQTLHPVLDSLNQLGNCAWKINKPLLDIIISIFNDRGSDKLDIPPPLSEAPKMPHFNPQDPTLTSSEKAHLKREAVNARRKYSEMYSLRMSSLYKLSIANHMRDEIFWFPHSMDFRGRTYPCPPYFNHLGSDVARAILVFAEGKPLGPKGLDWLKIHLVNLTGLKKRESLQGRLEYANTIMEDILDAADNPLNGNKWWMNADEPWQALACCTEIANAVRSPDPTQFISHFPVHQDGSCNGLQHYAALGRDVIGATSVNLMPCEVPQDVYSGVAQQVEEFRARDAASGMKIAQVLEGFISRKVVKQTVMTVVYGVTRYGGRLQIEKRLKEIDEFPKEHVWDASHYLVRLVFSGLKEMFTGTREIQDWLTESARLISKSGHTVEWLTPLGLPVVQPYRRTRHQVVSLILRVLKIIGIYLSAGSFDTPESGRKRKNTVKQKNAFPPNFIHSLDSTHMMLTALHCYSAGLTFVSVHDCFWTHALTVDTMNKVCREQFVNLHSQPILKELSKFLLEKYCDGPLHVGIERLFGLLLTINPYS